MKPVRQTKFTDLEAGVHGNCFAACVASLLEVPIEECPPFEDLTDGKWYLALWGFLKQRGYAIHGTRNVRGHDTWPADRAVLEPLGPGVDGYYAVGGYSPRNVQRGHCVVYKDGQMVHDPHPSGAGLTTLWDIYMIEPASSEEQ